MTAALANPLLATPARALPRSVAIIGAGTIGPDIGYYLKSALPALELVLVDLLRKKADRRALAALRRSTPRRRWRVARWVTPMPQAVLVRPVTGSTDYGGPRRLRLGDRGRHRRPGAQAQDLR
jgi:enoyl-CoA hydratase/3-hydroxyacyl-CoA dehydrogenase